MISELFDASRWQAVSGFDFRDLTYHRAVDQGTVGPSTGLNLSKPLILRDFNPLEPGGSELSALLSMPGRLL